MVQSEWFEFRAVFKAREFEKRALRKLNKAEFHCIRQNRMRLSCIKIDKKTKKFLIFDPALNCKKVIHRKKKKKHSAGIFQGSRRSSGGRYGFTCHELPWWCDCGTGPSSHSTFKKNEDLFFVMLKPRLPVQTDVPLRSFGEMTVSP